MLNCLLKILFYYLLPFLLLFTFSSCEKDPYFLANSPTTDTTKNDFVYNPTPYDLKIPEGFPEMEFSESDSLTTEGVELGRKLFYEPLLSGDNTQSCASCHAQDFSFSDNEKSFSTGIDGEQGTRNAQAIINAGWQEVFFWDGRASSLEEQALAPVPNPVEMHQEWPDAVQKLQESEGYPQLFLEAFGTDTIDSMLVVKAIAQFEKTMISANSRYDKYLRKEVSLTTSELNGFDIFFTEKGDCFHCHGTVLLTDNDFHNNGLDATFTDPGLGEITEDPNDEGKFKTPTLRNIEYTAPYMHDGRFQTLEEVVEFYSSGLQHSSTIDPLMKNVDDGGIQLTDQEKKDLIAFLKAFSDSTYLNNTDFSSPF